MLKLGQCFIGLWLFGAQAAYAVPQTIQLQYDVLRNGKRFATLNETFTQNGKQYTINSVTKGLGIYALLGQRTMSSTGEVTKDGLKPTRFELRQGKGGKKAYISDFNWVKNKLNMQMNGENKTEALSKGTQDLASYVYQFMYVPPKSDDLKINLTTGKKLHQYRYKIVQRDVAVDAGGNSYKTILISNEAASNDDKKQLWLAENQNYLPVRYKLTDDDGNEFEQVLTKIHVE